MVAKVSVYCVVRVNKCFSSGKHNETFLIHGKHTSSVWLNYSEACVFKRDEWESFNKKTEIHCKELHLLPCQPVWSEFLPSGTSRSFKMTPFRDGSRKQFHKHTLVLSTCHGRRPSTMILCSRFLPLLRTTISQLEFLEFDMMQCATFRNTFRHQKKGTKNELQAGFRFPHVLLYVRDQTFCQERFLASTPES